MGDAAQLAETSEEEPLEFAITPNRLPPGVDAAVAIVGLGYQWINGIVPFTIDNSLSHPDRVKAAIKHWQQFTPVHFIVRTDEDDYVTFRTREDACYSRVGRVGGEQFVNLGPSCDIGNAIHEIGHVMGLWHEHSRADRDNFVHIEYPNIKKDFEHNFSQRAGDSVDIGEYDYASIMHYPSIAFSRNGRPTIVPLNATVSIGKGQRLSVGDIVGIRTRLGTAHKIIARHSNKALTLNGGSSVNGTSIIQRTVSDEPAQRWRLVDTGSHGFFITCQASGTLLDLALGAQTGPACAQGWERNGGPNQRWRIRSSTEQYFCIVSETTGNVLDVESGSLKDGARVVENVWQATESQQWSFED